MQPERLPATSVQHQLYFSETTVRTLKDFQDWGKNKKGCSSSVPTASWGAGEAGELPLTWQTIIQG